VAPVAALILAAVGMSDQDMGHGLAAHRVEQRRRMRPIVGAGIDDRDLASAHDVADGTGEGERARIVAEDPAHAGPDFVDDAWTKRKVAIERDVVGISHGIFSLTSFRDGSKSQTRNLEGIE